MSKADEKKWRAAFRKAVLERDGFKCKVCGEAGTNETLDPHHITDRNELANGGYVPENGITLCKKVGGCHEKAEHCLKLMEGLNVAVAATVEVPLAPGLAANPLCVDYAEFQPAMLYKMIGSTYEKAVEAATKLKSE